MGTINLKAERRGSLAVTGDAQRSLELADSSTGDKTGAHGYFGSSSLSGFLELEVRFQETQATAARALSSSM